VNSDFCLVFEDHSDATKGSSINVKKARQVFSHPNWIRANVTGSEQTEIVPILVTPVLSSDKDAMPHLDQVLIWPLEDFRAWADMALEKVREFRRTFAGAGDLVWKANTVKGYVDSKLDPRTIVTGLKKGSEYFKG
jgi:hypothetical protein